MPGAREVPDEWRRSVRDQIRSWAERTFKGRKYTTRQLADAMGMKQPTVVQLLNENGSFGLHILVQVRDAIDVSLDELIGRGTAQASSGRQISDADVDAIATRILDKGRESAPDEAPLLPAAPAPARRRKTE